MKSHTLIISLLIFCASFLNGQIIDVYYPIQLNAHKIIPQPAIGVQGLLSKKIALAASVGLGRENLPLSVKQELNFDGSIRFFPFQRVKKMNLIKSQKEINLKRWKGKRKNRNVGCYSRKKAYSQPKNSILNGLFFSAGLDYSEGDMKTSIAINEGSVSKYDSRFFERYAYAGIGYFLRLEKISLGIEYTKGVGTVSVNGPEQIQNIFNTSSPWGLRQKDRITLQVGVNF